MVFCGEANEVGNTCFRAIQNRVQKSPVYGKVTVCGRFEELVNGNVAKRVRIEEQIGSQRQELLFLFHHVDGDIGGNFAMQSQRDFEISQGLDGFIQNHFAAIDSVTLFLERFGDVLRSHGAE